MLCATVCSARLVKEFNPSRSAVYVESLLPEKLVIRPYVCIQCDEHPCVESCPVEAIIDNKELGIYVVDKELCTACGACVEVCPYNGLRLDPAETCAIKCDICKGKPRCVEICPEGTLEIVK
jgi:Fe-S-cluster-containing hydrogenase component 2